MTLSPRGFWGAIREIEVIGSGREGSLLTARLPCYVVNTSCRQPRPRAAKLGQSKNSLAVWKVAMEVLDTNPSLGLRGATRASYEAHVLERRIAFWVVLIPFLALLVGIILLLRSAVGRVELLLLLGMYWISHIGIGLGYHRHFSHRSFQTTRPIKAILAIMGSTAAQGPVVQWAATHRRHHTLSDHPGDPHSPHLHEPGFMNTLRGFWHAHTGWMFEPEVYDWVLYVPELVKDKTLMRLNRLYFLWVFLGLALPS